MQQNKPVSIPMEEVEVSTNNEDEQRLIPGYTVRVFDNEPYIVPLVLEPSTNQALAAVRERAAIDALQEEGGVSFSGFVWSSYYPLNVSAPVDFLSAH